MIKEGAKIAAICCGGPPNVFFGSQAFATCRQGLQLNGHDFHGVYAVSGSCPTALLGCIGEEKKLCNICFNLTPGEIVGDKEELEHFVKFLKRFEHWRTMLPRFADIKDIKMVLPVIHRLKQGHIYSHSFLLRLIEKHCLPELDRIFGQEAIIMKIGVVDFLTGQHIVFSNKTPEHKDWLCVGTVASMGIVPLFPAMTIDKPKELKLTEKTHSKYNLLFLIDGGYRTKILLEEAIREPIGYDVIFIIDIDGLEYKEFDPSTPYNLVTRIQRSESIASTTNARLELSLVDRIDEEIAIRDKLIELRKSAGNSQEIDEIIQQMNNGRLRLSDKHAPERVMISSAKHAPPFDFTKFSQVEAIQLMRFGHNAALEALKRLGLSTEGIPLIKPY